MSRDRELWKSVSDLHAGDSVPKREVTEKLIAGLTDLLIEQGGGQDISTFFRSVGQGVVAGQRSLDEQAREYNTDGPVQPKTYHVSQAKARLCFGISSMSSRGFNVIIASDKEQTERMQKQEVEFDIVAAPPPPDALPSTLRVADLVELDAQRRKDVIKVASRVKGQAGKEHVKALFDLGNQKRILVLPDDTGWMLVRPAPDDGSEVRSIHLVRVMTDGTVRARKARTPTIPALAQVLVRLVEWQQFFLG